MKKLQEKNINTPKHWDDVYNNEIEGESYRIAEDRFEGVASMIEDGTTVLDAGCGTGEFVNFLKSKKENCNVCGIDFSEAAIKEAKRKYPKNAFLVQDVMTMSSTFKDYEYIVSFETIEHLSDPLAFVLETKKTLKKGGFLVLTMPYENSVDGGEEHIFSFDFKDMISIFEDSDAWEIVAISRYSEYLRNMLVIAKKK